MNCKGECGCIFCPVNWIVKAYNYVKKTIKKY